MNRRRFLVGVAGTATLGLGVPQLTGVARAATEEDLAYANFGLSVAYLLRDFYAQALEAKAWTGQGANVLKRGRSVSAQHVAALRELLIGAGEEPAAEEDFAFEWPARTFRSSSSVGSTGLSILKASLGAYQSAAALASEPRYRVLYASLAASAAEQLGSLAALTQRAGVEPFPVALDLEAASAAVEDLLG